VVSGQTAKSVPTGETIEMKNWGTRKKVGMKGGGGGHKNLIQGSIFYLINRPINCNRYDGLSPGSGHLGGDGFS